MAKTKVLSDYYSLLQVSRYAEQAVIDAAFAALAQQPNAKIKELQKAHDTLSNEAKRREYDQKTNNLEGVVIGDFRALEHIADGGLGSTYRGEHILSGKPVCIKHCHNVSDEENEILFEEAMAMWELRHFSIPAIRNIIRMADSRLALIMSFIPGLTLEKIVKKVGALPPEHVAWIMERILNPLMYIHYHGTIHGDIKPQNIIAQHETHTICIVDFGLSQVKADKSDVRGYTENFSPPEQVRRMINRDLPLLPETDFYSLGVTAIYALTGDMEKVKRRLIPPNTPAPLADFVKRLISYNVTDRPNWEDEDLCDTIKKIRMDCFGRTSTGLAPIPGLT